VYVRESGELVANNSIRWAAGGAVLRLWRQAELITRG
jgi:hypothetical protein